MVEMVMILLKVEMVIDMLYGHEGVTSYMAMMAMMLFMVVKVMIL
jgi:hypothetical protein